jgi:apolipoprotein N-acyltransferase
MSATSQGPGQPALPGLYLRSKPLAPLSRFGLVLLTWGLIAVAQPGVLRPDGHGHLAFFAIAPWALAASRPGRKAFLAEWLAHSLGLASVFFWMLDFMPAILAPMSLVPALYPTAAGVLLRRCRRWPLALLAPAAWLLAEAVRWCLPVPFSFGWFRLGMLMHDTEWIVGSAAWFGTWGLSWGMAALGGLLADLVLSVKRPAGTRYPILAGLVFGLGPLLGLVGLSQMAGQALVTTAGGTSLFEPGPDLLVVQPGISQEIKAARRDPLIDRYVPQVTSTLQALYETRPEGQTGDDAQPDLVLWGETFLPGKLASPDVKEAFAAGARPAPWAWPFDQPMGASWFLQRDNDARELVRALLGTAENRQLWRGVFDAGHAVEWAERVILGQRLLPPGTSFLSGIEAWTTVEAEGKTELRSLNAVALWSADGRMSELASKVHLVPGGETGEPLRAVPFVLSAVKKIARAIPDFVGAEEPSVLTLTTRDGGAYRMAIAVCFDNAFDDPFTQPLRSGPVDFFVVASNEAWYGDSPLMDHMLAFTRIAAAATQRAIVRATNSGISCVVGPDGEALAILEVGEEGAAPGKRRRKMVAGALRSRVPVPRRDRGAAAAPMTFFIRAEPWLGPGVGGLGLLILGLCILGSRGIAANSKGDGYPAS